MNQRWTARHKGGAQTTMTEAEVRAYAAAARFKALWLGDGIVRIGDWTITKETP